jgi:AcrR family transcriptional regulator
MHLKAKRTQVRGEVTRAAIMRAAIKLFAEKGYKGTSVRAIVDKAETSMGSFYHHFGDKADLYIQIADEGSLAVRRFMRDVGDFGSDMSVEERVWEFFRAYVDAVDKHGAMVLLLISEKETLPPRIKKMVEGEINLHRRELEQGLTAGVKAGILAPMDARMASEVIVGMVIHMVKVYFADPTVRREAVINTLARATLGIFRSLPERTEEHHVKASVGS